jgi:hypothetical protein
MSKIELRNISSTTKTDTGDTSPSQRQIKIRAILDDVQNEVMRACFKIFETPYPIVSVFLFVFILISTGLASFLVIETIISYLSYEVTTTTRTIYELSSSFPKITICNVNPFTTLKSKEFLKEINDEYDPTIDMFNQTQINTLNYTAKLAFFGGIYGAANTAMLNLSDKEKKSLGHDIDDILIACQFNSEPCDANDFVWKFDKFFGNCFVFNSGLNKTTNEPVDYKNTYVAGSLFGLNLQFYVNFYEEFNTLYSINYKGAYVRIENSSLYSDDLLDNGIYIAPAKWTSALIQRVVNYVLPKPYSPCELDNNSGVENKDTILLRLFYHSRYQYTQQSCVIQCLQYQSIQKCNCTYPLYLSLFEKTHDICLTKNQTDCYNTVWTSFLQKNYVQVNFFFKLSL